MIQGKLSVFVNATFSPTKAFLVFGSEGATDGPTEMAFVTKSPVVDIS
jgi:hypothetical protein